MLYVLVPVLVHVLLDGSGHDSAEIDGTRVERHATSAPTKQPVPAPRHSTRSSMKTDFRLDLADTKPYTLNKTSKTRDESAESKPVQGQQHHFSPDKSGKNSPTSKIPVRVKKPTENGRGECNVEFDDDQHRTDFAARDVEDESPGEKEARQPEEDKERSDSSLKSEPSNETQTATTVEETCCPVLPVDESTRETSARVVDKLLDSKLERRSTESSEVVRTIRCTTESYGTETNERVGMRRAERGGGDYGEDAEASIPCSVAKCRDPVPGFDIEQASSDRNMIKSDTELSEPWAQASLSDRSFPNDEKVEQWESQLSQDTSPGSGNGDIYTKNGSSRHDLNSDTDSDGSPRSRRRSPSKRCTLGSSSGSDVALHEGAELSPLEDDQGTALTANLLSKQCTYPANQLTHRETQLSQSPRDR